MTDVEIGIGKTGRRAYGFDDIAIVPSRRTRDPKDVDISWDVDAFHFDLPVMAAPADSVVSPATAMPVHFHLLSGGLMLGAWFMATDMVTTPVTRPGLLIFGVGCGVLTAIIRLIGGYPEGVCYSILLMNTAVPLIDRYTRPRVFGAKGAKK
jgi:electron transport complex protein RnfD